MIGGTWVDTVDAAAVQATSGYLMGRLLTSQPAGTEPARVAAFTVTLTLAGTDHLRALVTRFVPPGSAVEVVHELRGEAAPSAPNLYVQCATADRMSALGMKIALADVLFMDWEAPARGVQSPWRALVQQAVEQPVAWTHAGLSGRLQDLGPAIQAVLVAGADRPLEYRARLIAAMVSSADPQAFEAAKQRLLREYSDMGMRHQVFTGERPSTAEVNRRFASMPFERAPRSGRNR